MIIFNNHFYYFIVLLNIMIGCYNDINNIRYLKIHYVNDLFKHKNHIYAYILCRCYFNGAIIGFILFNIINFMKLFYIKYLEYFCHIFITIFHIYYIIDKLINNKNLNYKDILAIYGFHTGYINLVE